jgi:hypothetical protein
VAVVADVSPLDVIVLALRRRFVYRHVSQTEARKALRKVMAGAKPPRATVDQHGRPRVGWNVPDGREVIDRRPRTFRRSA